MFFYQLLPLLLDDYYFFLLFRTLHFGGFFYFIPFICIYYMIKLFRPVDFFKYSEDEKQKYIKGVVRYYAENHIAKDNVDTIIFSIEELLSFFEQQKKLCIWKEEYEEAEVYSLLIKIFISLLKDYSDV